MKDSNCSIDTPCDNNKICNIETGNCISDNLIKKEILNPTTGLTVNVIGTPEKIQQIESNSQKDSSNFSIDSSDSVLVYLNESFKNEGMTDVDNDKIVSLKLYF